MSNPIKAVGKVFKKVVKVVKKVALPVLAVGAVVLTGGAAIGALPSIGSMLGSIGLSATSGLGAVLSTAAKAATFGAATSAIMGKNPIKGATTGFMMGAAGSALGLMPAGSGPMSALGFGKSAAEQSLANVGSEAMKNVAAINSAGTAAVNGTAPAVGGFASAAPPVASSAPSIAPAVTPAAPVASAPPVAPAAAPVPTTAPPPQAGSGFGSILSQNPMMAGMLMQGVGGALSAKAASKDRMRELNRRAENYADTSGFFALDDTPGRELPNAGDFYRSRVYGRVQWDPRIQQYVDLGAG